MKFMIFDEVVVILVYFNLKCRNLFNLNMYCWESYTFIILSRRSMKLTVLSSYVSKMAYYFWWEVSFLVLCQVLSWVDFSVLCQVLGWVNFSAYFLYLNFFELDILPDSIYLKPDKYFYCTKKTASLFIFKLFPLKLYY